MSAPHATARRVNVARAIMVRLEGHVDGAELIPPGDDRAPQATGGSFVRVTLASLPGRYSGRLDGLPATREGALVMVECWLRGGEGEAVTVVDAVDQLSDAVAHRLRYLDLPFVDYLGDGATVAGAAIRAMEPPISRPLGTSEGYQRRLVEVPIYWFSKHSG